MGNKGESMTLTELLAIDGPCYFAHPYTVKDDHGRYIPAGEDANFMIASYWGGLLIQAGLVIYNPISHTHPMHSANPLFLSRHEHEMWYRLDETQIRHTNWVSLILGLGWRLSKGCLAERTIFTNLGKPIVMLSDLIPELLERGILDAGFRRETNVPERCGQGSGRNQEPSRLILPVCPVADR